MAKRKYIEPFRKAVRLYRGASGSQILIPPPPEWFEKLKLLEPIYAGGEITCVVQVEYGEGYDDYPGIELLFYPGGPSGRLYGSGLKDGKGIDVNEILYPETPERLARSHSSEFKKAFGMYVCYNSIKGLRDALTKSLRDSRRRRALKRKQDEALYSAARSSSLSPQSP